MKLSDSVRSAVCRVTLGICALAGIASSAEVDKSQPLYILTPLVAPAVPAGGASNPIDAFLNADYQAKSLQRAGPADKATLLRRVYLDLVGMPPTPAEQETFGNDTSSDAYEKVVDKLLASEQHGVRYTRHWLDVLRYADADERMVAAPGIYLWRDWMINALNDDIPYDQFVRVQLTGYRSSVRTQITATGYRMRIEPRPEDQFALGLLSRGQVLRDGKDGQELAISAVETVSTAFMGLTVGCAKCHDHKFDPISKRDFYEMKALFDPLNVRKLNLASPADLFANGRTTAAQQRKQSALQAPVDAFAAPYKKKLYDDRVAMLPADVQEVIRKPESQRTVAEQKIADDYYPIVRIDEDKLTKAMTPEDRRKYAALKRAAGNAPDPTDGMTARPSAIPAFWTVEVDARREAEKSYILTSGDPLRPETDHPVEPGWPFAPKKIDFRDGRVEAFSDWLTAPENPMLARVAMNRLWQWHFGEGLEKTTSDFGRLAGPPADPKLLDWLASEMVHRGFSMKQMNRLIVTSDAYKRSSAVSDEQIAANRNDPADNLLWHFRLERLDAEPIWDSIMAAAGTLDTSVGGPSFDVGGGGGRGRRGGGGIARRPTGPPGSTRRAAYMIRGFSTSRDVVPVFLQAFDVDDGRVPCPLRTQTVTAPQGLFMMNSDQVETASAKFAERLKKDSGGDNSKAIDLAYRTALGRPPSESEMKRSLDYIGENPDGLKSFAWIIFNLDEFIYVR